MRVHLCQLFDDIMERFQNSTHFAEVFLSLAAVCFSL